MDAMLLLWLVPKSLDCESVTFSLLLAISHWIMYMHGAYELRYTSDFTVYVVCSAATRIARVRRGRVRGWFLPHIVVLGWGGDYCCSGIRAVPTPPLCHARDSTVRATEYRCGYYIFNSSRDNVVRCVNAFKFVRLMKTMAFRGADFSVFIFLGKHVEC